MPLDPRMEKLKSAQSRTSTPISPGASLMPPTRGGGGLPGQAGSPFKRAGAVGGRRAGASGGSGQKMAELIANLQGGQQSQNTPGASFGPGGPSAVGGQKQNMLQQIMQRRKGEVSGNRPDAVSRRLGR